MSKTQHVNSYEPYTIECEVKAAELAFAKAQAKFERALQSAALNVLLKYRSVQEVVCAMGSTSFYGLHIRRHHDNSISINRNECLGGGRDLEDERLTKFYKLLDRYEEIFGSPGPWRFKRDGKIVTTW